MSRGSIGSAAESEALAASVESTDGVTYVPALLGFGTPYWDYGARGALLGVTRGTTAAHVTRAVLEGVAHRGADRSAHACCSSAPPALRPDATPLNPRSESRVWFRP